MMATDNIEGFKSFLKMQLAKNTMQINFTKKNGEDRKMICTRNPDVISSYTETKLEESTRKENSESCRVFDLDKKAWRSFNYDSVYSYYYLQRV